MTKRASRVRHALIGYAFLSPALIGVLIFMVVPIVVIMWVSLYRWDLIGDTRYVGLANVTNVLSDPAFLSSLRTTILFVLLVVPIQIILGLLLAGVLAYQDAPPAPDLLLRVGHLRHLGVQRL